MPSTASTPAAPRAAWPRSLFGRLILVLGAGLVLAQLISAAIHLAERGQLVQSAGGRQSVQRVADIVRLLDPLPVAERRRLAAVLSVPPTVVALRDLPPATLTGNDDLRARRLRALLARALGDDRPVRVQVRALPDGLGTAPAHAHPWRGEEAGRHPPWASPGSAAMGGYALVAAVALRDGGWVLFDQRIPQDDAQLPLRTLAALAVTLLAALGLSFIAVRWVTRPLRLLSGAAEALGRDIRRPPLPETGPLEVRQAAHAFNTMQRRLVRFIDDRSRVFAAMSHDLKTPITRLRLRAALLEDEDMRERIERDLAEMEAMVAHALDFMRGAQAGEPRQPVDLQALVESLQADQREQGHDVTVQGRIDHPLPANPALLRRCVGNLLDNAVRYGGSATIVLHDTPHAVRIDVLDAGPGIPSGELEQVFEPFHRVESSRNRATGGTGLGLTIARDIAHLHGGEVQLANRKEGGLRATLTLPRQASEAPPRG